MRIVLDTHVLLWWFEDERKLSRRDKLKPASFLDEHGLNQLLTTRTPDDLVRVLPKTISLTGLK